MPVHWALLRFATQCTNSVGFLPTSKMINLSVPDTIDERAINKKKLTPFIIQVLHIPVFLLEFRFC